jgi:hypothetical protein
LSVPGEPALPWRCPHEKTGVGDSGRRGGEGWRLQLCRIAAVELGPSDVTVNVIRPGLVRVPRQDLPPEMERDFLSIIPLHRLGEPRDIAGIVGFLVGPEARWLTGQVISVDGGQTLNRAFDATAWVEPVFGKERMRGLVQ